MITPAPCSTMWRAARAVHRKCPLRFASSTRSQVASSISRKCLTAGPTTAALLTRMSRRPKRSRQASNARSTSSARGDVALDAEAALAERRGRLARQVAVDLGDRDARALAPVALGDRASEPAAAARDERDATGQPSALGHRLASRSRSTSTRRSSLPEGDLGITSISSQARSCMWGATRPATNAMTSCGSSA